MIDILIAHHLSIVADLEREGAEQTRKDCFKYIDEAIDIFMRVIIIQIFWTSKAQNYVLHIVKIACLLSDIIYTRSI